MIPKLLFLLTLILAILTSVSMTLAHNVRQKSIAATAPLTNTNQSDWVFCMIGQKIASISLSASTNTKVVHVFDGNITNSVIKHLIWQE